MTDEPKIHEGEKPLHDALVAETRRILETKRETKRGHGKQNGVTSNNLTFADTREQKGSGRELRITSQQNGGALLYQSQRTQRLRITYPMPIATIDAPPINKLFGDRPRFMG